MAQTPSTHITAATPAGIRAAHSERVLSCHRFQGDSNDCGPFTVAMLVEGLTGRGVDPSILARELDRPRWRGLWRALPLLRRIPGFATFPWGLVDALRQHGMRARWQRGGDEAELRGWLKASLGVVVLYGGWSPRPWAHYVVLLAEDPERGWGVADPGRPTAALRWIDRDSFARRWRRMGRVAVIAGGG